MWKIINHELNMALVSVYNPRVPCSRKKKKKNRHHHRNTKISNTRQGNAETLGASKTEQSMSWKWKIKHNEKKISIKMIQEIQVQETVDISINQLL